MFDRGETPASAANSRYRFELVGGEMRQKSHQRKVQETLDEGSSRGWELVSANTTNTSGAYVTGIYWDTGPQR